MKILVCAPLQEAESKKIQEYFLNDTVVISRRPTQEDIDQADVIVGNPHLDLNLNQEHLQALLLNSAGSDQYIKEGILNKTTKLTNASGSYGIVCKRNSSQKMEEFLSMIEKILSKL